MSSLLSLTRRLGPLPAGNGQDNVQDTLTLSYDDRIKGRLRVTLDSGRAAGLFLERGPVLRHGDGLEAEDGSRVRVIAAAEPVVTAWVAPGTDAGLSLARLCYHLGNRHVTLGIGEGEYQGDACCYVRFAPDHVLEELAERLGARLEHHQAPFDPEPGAYTMGGHAHGHSHGHSHGHDNGHDNGHEHDHSPGHSHDASHGHDNGHDHDHSPGHLHDASHGHGHSHGSSHSHTQGIV
ncbi:urease accessory protein UreE [Halomonas litopenaei]|uniref:urease accessory protein UreE n=1 Tax=Halomonas litopenaei TaxID=2109328 RepID=UPI003F9F7909